MPVQRHAVAFQIIAQYAPNLALVPVESTPGLPSTRAFYLDTAFVKLLTEQHVLAVLHTMFL